MTSKNATLDIIDARELSFSHIGEAVTFKNGESEVCGRLQTFTRNADHVILRVFGGKPIVISADEAITIHQPVPRYTSAPVVGFHS